MCIELENCAVPKSASFISTLPMAAEPPSSLSPSNLNSLTHTSPHLERPSSVLIKLYGSLTALFRTPIMATLTIPKSGFPRIVIFLLSVVLNTNGTLEGNFCLFLSSLALTISAICMTISFESGHTIFFCVSILSLYSPGGVTLSGTSYS